MEIRKVKDLIVAQYLVIILFVFGLLLAVAGFFVDHSGKIKFVLKIVSPDGAEAKEGMKTLRSRGTLDSEDCGFTQISKIFLKELESQNAPEKLEGIKVIKISRKGAELAFSTARVREVIPIEFELSNGQKIKWNLEELGNPIDKRVQRRLFVIACIVFSIGLIIQTVSFGIGLKK